MNKRNQHSKNNTSYSSNKMLALCGVSSALLMAACSGSKGNSPNPNAQQAASAEVAPEAVSAPAAPGTIKNGYVRIKGKWIKSKYVDQGAYATVGDIVLSKSNVSENPPTSGEVGLLTYSDANGKIATDTLWPNARIKYHLPSRIISNSAANGRIKDAINAAIKEFEAKSPLRFEAVTTVSNDVLRFITKPAARFPGSDVVSTGVGYHTDPNDALTDANGEKLPLNVIAIMGERAVAKVNNQNVRLDSSPERLKIAIMRELAKVVGLDSELHRSDRDKYVQIDSTNLKGGLEIPIISGSVSGDFDYNSITLYGPMNDLMAIDPIKPIFRKKDSSTALGGSTGLSAGDARGISLMYGSSPAEGFDVPYFVLPPPASLAGVDASEGATQDFNVEVANVADCSHLEVKLPQDDTLTANVSADASKPLLCKVEVKRVCKVIEPRPGIFAPAFTDCGNVVNTSKIEFALSKVKGDATKAVTKASGDGSGKPIDFGIDRKNTYAWSQSEAIRFAPALKADQLLATLGGKNSEFKFKISGEDAQFFKLVSGNQLKSTVTLTKDSYTLAIAGVSPSGALVTKKITLHVDLPRNESLFEINGKVYFIAKDHNDTLYWARICEIKTDSNQRMDELASCLVSKEAYDGRKIFTSDAFAVGSRESCTAYVSFLGGRHCRNAGVPGAPPVPKITDFKLSKAFYLSTERDAIPLIGRLRATGGTNHTYSIVKTGDSEFFKIENRNELKATQNLTKKNYTITIVAQNAEGFTETLQKQIEELKLPDEPLAAKSVQEPRSAILEDPRYNVCPNRIPLKISSLSQLSAGGTMTISDNKLICKYKVASQSLNFSNEKSCMNSSEVTENTNLTETERRGWTLTKFATANGKKPSLYLFNGDWLHDCFYKLTSEIEVELTKNVSGYNCKLELNGKIADCKPK